jgi:hypothetical protein
MANELLKIHEQTMVLDLQSAQDFMGNWNINAIRVILLTCIYVYRR